MLNALVAALRDGRVDFRLVDRSDGTLMERGRSFWESGVGLDLKGYLATAKVRRRAWIAVRAALTAKNVGTQPCR